MEEGEGILPRLRLSSIATPLNVTDGQTDGRIYEYKHATCNRSALQAYALHRAVKTK